MNKYLMQTIISKHLKNREILLVCVISFYDYRRLGYTLNTEFLIFLSKNDFQEYLREQIDTELGICGEFVAKYRKLLSTDALSTITKNIVESAYCNILQKDSKHIVAYFCYLHLRNNYLIHNKFTNIFCKEIIKIKYKNVIIFVDAYHNNINEYCFYNNVEEITTYIKNRLEDYISSKKCNIFSANIRFSDWHHKLESKLHMVKEKIGKEPNMDWYRYFYQFGRIKMKIIPTDDIHFYQKKLNK
jgi:hypothetical protein